MEEYIWEFVHVKLGLYMFKESEMMYKRNELMKIMAISIVLLFLISGFSAMAHGSVPKSSISSSGMSGNIYRGSITPSVQNSTQNNSGGYVKYTLDLINNTLFNGNFVTTNYGIGPDGAAFDSANGYIYVTNVGSDNVSVINGSTNNVIASIGVGVGSSPDGAAFDSANGYIYVTNVGSDNVSVINGATNKVIASIGVGVAPDGAAFDSANGYIYVANFRSGSVSVINGATNKVIASIGVGVAPDGAAFDSANGYIYVTKQYSNSVSVINGATNKVIASIGVGSSPGGAAFDSANGYIYVTNSASLNVSVINGATNKVIASIGVGVAPDGAAFDSANGYIYVANDDSNNVSVINGATNKVIAGIGVGLAPDGAAFDSANGYIYVANFGSGTVSIISTSSQVMKQYSVTFTESGLPSGASWSVTFNGATLSSTTNTIVFNELNGTYSYVVASVSGYTVSPSSGSITVNGENIEKVVTFTPSNIYNMSFGVLYKGSQYTINLNVSSTDLKNALSLNSLPDELTLSNISTYILDFEWHPNSYSIYSVRLISQNGSTVTNETTKETILYQTLVWAMLYNEISLLQSTYGSQSTSYSDLISLQQTQWVQEAGIDLSDFVNYATLVGPILGELSTFFSSSSTDAKLANMATHAIFDLLKGYESLENNFPQGATSILDTLAQYGLISSTNPSEYNPEIFVANLAQLNPSDYNSLVLAIYSDLGVQSTQVPFSVEKHDVKILENLGENALSVGLSAATSSAVTFLQAYYGAQFTLEAASSVATDAAMDSISSSVSDFMAFMLPLSIANAIYSSYLEPMSSYLEQIVNAQDLMYNTLYPAIMNTLNSYSEGNYANVSDAILSMILIGMITSEWYTWVNASIAELKGEFLDFNANQQIQTAEQSQSSLFNNEREIYFALNNASIMADSLINGQQPTLNVTPGFYYIIPSLPSNFNQIELALGQGWQQFTNDMSSAIQYAENGWSSLTSGISNMFGAFSDFLFGRDTPEFIVMMDNFTAEQEAGFLKSTYPLSSVIYGNNSVILVLPGNLSGYVSIEVNESVGVNATYYNESSSQMAGVLTSFNAESGNAYIMYVRSNNTGKKALVAGYSLSFNHSEYSNVPWEVKISSSNGSIISEIESNSSEIAFNDLPNGTYNFSLSPLNNTYRATPMTGKVSINGYNQTEQITFSLVNYTITFYEKGLPSGTSWSVTLNGTTKSSTTDTITFSVPNGTYSYSIGSVSGYTASNSNGSVTVSGKNIPVSITFSSTSPTAKQPSSGIPSIELYGIIGAVVAVAAIGSAVALIRKRR